VLGINRIKGGGEGYYLDAVAEGIDEYYRGVGEAPGWWAGTLAGDHLDLAGEIDSEDLRAVWGGLDPRTGVKLGRFNGREVNGFDLCWRAPKSVSLLFAFGSPEISRVVREAHDHAVDESLRYLERHAARTRKGQRGINGESVGGLAVAMFRHRTSRTGDPHLHTHGLAANIAKADDGIWRTLDGRLLFNHAKTAGFLYQAELRHELSRRLGVEWTPVEKGVADIVGIDRSVIWEFSERRRQIIEHLDEVGFRTARAAQIATLATRPDKTTPDETSIWRVWEAKAETIDFEPTSVNDVVVGPREVVIEDELVDGLLDRLAGPEGLTQNDSTFDRRHALMGLAEGLPEGAPVALVEDLAERFLRRPDIAPSVRAGSSLGR
jgi:conjugative relaxase-like TrwC/TraI family protein